MNERTTVVAIGQLPPPISGFSYITACVLKIAGRDVKLLRHDLTGKRGALGLRKHVSRFVATLRACAGLVKHAGASKRLCYIACEGGYGLVYTLSVVAIARLCGYPTQLHHHSFNYIDNRNVMMRAILALAPRGVHLFLCSIMHEKFVARYHPVTARIVSNAAFVPPHLRTQTTVSKEIVLGHLSNLTREKGLYTYLDLLRAAGPNVRGILAGPVANDADSKAIEAAVRDLGGRLEYRGPIYGAGKDDFYNEIDLFIFPTNYVNEAQPTVLFEALAAGCQVISYNRGCIIKQVNEDGLVIGRDDDFVGRALSWIAINGLSARTGREAVRCRYADYHDSTRMTVMQLFHLNSA